MLARKFYNKYSSLIFLYRDEFTGEWKVLKIYKELKQSCTEFLILLRGQNTGDSNDASLEKKRELKFGGFSWGTARKDTSGAITAKMGGPISLVGCTKW